MDQTRYGFCTKQWPQSRMRTLSENGSSYPEKPVHLKEKPRVDKQKESAQCNDMAGLNENTGEDLNQETFRELIHSHSVQDKRVDDVKKGLDRHVVANQLRPRIQRKSHSDLTSYSNTKIRILVEGKELPSTEIEETYSSNGFKNSLHEPSVNKDHVADVQGHHTDKNKLRTLVGWFGKAHARAYDLKNAEKISAETAEKRSPMLKRSRSFSGRIREKFKMNFGSNEKQTEPVFQPPKSNYLQPPKTFNKNNMELKGVNGIGIPQYGLQRRYSDQTDSMSRRPLGGRRDIRACPAYFSLDRGLLQMSIKKPLTRKRSNSLEKQEDDFAFWSQISDADRSRSCSARISVTEQLDTHRDNDGMLETNLCSTEL